MSSPRWGSNIGFDGILGRDVTDDWRTVTEAEFYALQSKDVRGFELRWPRDQTIKTVTHGKDNLEVVHLHAQNRTVINGETVYCMASFTTSPQEDQIDLSYYDLMDILETPNGEWECIAAYPTEAQYIASLTAEREGVGYNDRNDQPNGAATVASMQEDPAGTSKTEKDHTFSLYEEMRTRFRARRTKVCHPDTGKPILVNGKPLYIDLGSGTTSIS